MSEKDDINRLFDSLSPPPEDFFVELVRKVHMEVLPCTLSRQRNASGKIWIIDAIKAYMAITGCSISEAMEDIEFMLRTVLRIGYTNFGHSPGHLLTILILIKTTSWTIMTEKITGKSVVFYSLFSHGPIWDSILSTAMSLSMVSP